VWIVKSPSPVKSSSYELSCIDCMAVTPVGNVIVMLQMTVIVIVNCVNVRANVQ
jgi:hypothetical protein